MVRLGLLFLLREECWALSDCHQQRKKRSRERSRESSRERSRESSREFKLVGKKLDVRRGNVQRVEDLCLEKRRGDQRMRIERNARKER